MAPFFFFFTLCISLPSGAEDCSFDWSIRPIEISNWAGYMDPNARTAAAQDLKHLMHEIEHVICFLTYPEGHELNSCYQETDTRDIMAQSRNPAR